MPIMQAVASGRILAGVVVDSYAHMSTPQLRTSLQLLYQCPNPLTGQVDQRRVFEIRAELDKRTD